MKEAQKANDESKKLEGEIEYFEEEITKKD